MVSHAVAGSWIGKALLAVHARRTRRLPSHCLTRWVVRLLVLFYIQGSATQLTEGLGIAEADLMDGRQQATGQRFVCWTRCQCLE